MSERDRAAEELAEKWGRVRAQHIEMMAAAFALQTGLGPGECVLVEQRKGTKIRWWFEKREVKA